MFLASVTISSCEIILSSAILHNNVDGNKIVRRLKLFHFSRSEIVLYLYFTSKLVPKLCFLANFTE